MRKKIIVGPLKQIEMRGGRHAGVSPQTYNK